MPFIDFTSLATQVVAGLVVAAILFLAGFFYSRRKKSQRLAEKPKPIDIDKLIVKRNFYLPIPSDQVIVQAGRVLEAKSLLLFGEMSSLKFGEFVKNSAHFLQKRDPKQYYKLRKENPKDEDFLVKVRKAGQFRPTTPTSLKLRVVSNFGGETYCVAECYPELYFDMIKGTAVSQDQKKTEETLRLAKNECRVLVEDLVTNLGGRNEQPTSR